MMTKRPYVPPVAELVAFDALDILTASGGGAGGDPDGGWGQVWPIG